MNEVYNDESLVSHFDPLASFTPYFEVTACIENTSLTRSAFFLRASEATKAISVYRCTFVTISNAQTAVTAILNGH
ncbi:unnamed protein product [Brugia pahangi]|uniref:Uncharacterized protein n=1 Tax=Brugia pahangi TaxID=6280 RepID=A0A0N4TV09_BRUPA|nr:unnamed protein product [Brugia pahangi]